MAPTSMMPMPRTSMWSRVTPALVPITTRPSMSLSLVISSATRLYPRSTSASTHSLFPIPLSPFTITPTPRISTILPCSCPRGANRSSSASVARLINFMVINGLRKTGIESLSAKAKNSLSGRRFLENTNPGILQLQTCSKRSRRSFLESDFK